MIPQLSKTDPPVEKLLLSLMLHYPPYIQLFLELFPGFSFSGARTKELFHLFRGMAREFDEGESSASKLLNRIKDEALKTFASELLMMDWQSGEDRERAFQEALQALREQERLNHLKVLRNQISKAEDAGDQESVLKYMKAYQELLGKAG